MEMAGQFFFKWRVADLLVGFPDIEFGFRTRVRSLPDALRIATPKKRLLGAGGGFLTRTTTTTNTVTTTTTKITTHSKSFLLPETFKLV